jgi:hypothetical protein
LSQVQPVSSGQRTPCAFSSNMLRSDANMLHRSLTPPSQVNDLSDAKRSFRLGVVAGVRRHQSAVPRKTETRKTVELLIPQDGLELEAA